MTEKEINVINRFLEGNTFKVEVRLWSSDNPDFELDYMYKIIGKRKMISVGEYYDFLKVDIEIIGGDTITSQIFGIYMGREGDVKQRIENMLNKNYLVKVDLDKSINDTLKYFSNDYVRIVIENISISDSFIEEIKGTV